MGSIEVPPVQVIHQKDGLGLNEATVSRADDHPEVEEIVRERPNSNGVTDNTANENGAFGDDDLHVSPLWKIMHKMVPPRPNPHAVNTKWAYAQMRSELMKAAEVVSAEEAERRVLILVNQAMQPPYTTDTIYAGLQIVLPGEIAPAHRHRAFALRFIIEGSAGFTAVDGEKIEMFPGDVILTPSWSWHDHGNEGTDPIIWLDGLDLPLWQFLPINFLQQYSQPRYPSKLSPHSSLRFPWADIAQKLDADQGQHSVFLYRHQDGSHLSKTISAQAERIASGFTTSESKEVFSFVYHVYEGEGYTTIKTPKSSTSEKIEWKAKDTFAIPAWSTISHTCTSREVDAYLFAINDRPIVEASTFAGTEFLGKSI